jgi:Ca2+-binding RTX toxin-like protein
MTIQDVIANTNFDPAFSSSDLGAIGAALADLYSGSQLIRDMLDQVTATKKLTINFKSGKFEATAVNSFTLNIDLNALNWSYITPNGKAVAATLVNTLAHELVHAIGGFGEGNQTYPNNFAGDTVTQTNLIYTKLGIEHRLTYLGAGDSPDIIAGKDYTFGAQIDTAFYVDYTLNPDLSVAIGDNYNVEMQNHKANSSDLLIGGKEANGIYGFTGNDFIYGNGGNDFLYGGDGTDYLNGGADSDTLNGGRGNDVLDGGGNNDTAQYDTAANVKIIETTAASLAPYSSVDETDFILNVERIDGSASGDTLNISLLANTSVQEIHAGGGVDTVTVTGSAIPLKIYLDDGADILKSAPAGSVVYGGIGNDQFYLSNGNSLFGANYFIADAETGDRLVANIVQFNNGVATDVPVAVAGVTTPLGLDAYRLNDTLFLRIANDLFVTYGGNSGVVYSDSLCDSRSRVKHGMTDRASNDNFIIDYMVYAA